MWASRKLWVTSILLSSCTTAIYMRQNEPKCEFYTTSSTATSLHDPRFAYLRFDSHVCRGRPTRRAPKGCHDSKRWNSFVAKRDCSKLWFSWNIFDLPLIQQPSFKKNVFQTSKICITWRDTCGDFGTRACAQVVGLYDKHRDRWLDREPRVPAAFRVVYANKSILSDKSASIA